MTKLARVFFLALLTSPIAAIADDCAFKDWFEYKGNHILSHPVKPAYMFVTSHKSADADGAPNAYHPNDTGLDYLANAGYPNSRWWPDVLVKDPGNPTSAYRQPQGPYKGYFISKTSLQDFSKAETDTARYVDASSVPYLVFPGSFYSKKGTGKLGDLGYALNLSNGKTSPFIVADVGPKNAMLGEMSIRLAEGLGGEKVNPRNGDGLPKGQIVYVVFPYSTRKHPWPLSNAELDHTAQLLFQSLGGMNGVKACMPHT